MLNPRLCFAKNFKQNTNRDYNLLVLCGIYTLHRESIATGLFHLYHEIFAGAPEEICIRNHESVLLVLIALKSVT